MSALQESLLSHLSADVWSANDLAQSPAQVVATGDAALDVQLPGGGWPVGALTEVLQGAGLHCEWRLLLSGLVRSGSGPVVLVGAPQLPFAPSLLSQGLAHSRLLLLDAPDAASRLWAAEQSLRCAPVDAVLLWLPQPCRSDSLRRLHLAAVGHNKLLWVIRPRSAEHEASPAPLRLAVALVSDTDALQVQVLKRRGPPMARPLHLPARPARLSALLAASLPAPLAHAHDRSGSRHALACLATAA